MTAARGSKALVRFRVRRAHQKSLDVLVALLDMSLVGILERSCLGQREEMLGAVVAFQGMGDGLGRSLAPRVPIGRKRSWVTDAVQDSANVAHASFSGNVGDNMMQLQIHLQLRLLHVLDVRSGIVEETLTLT